MNILKSNIIALQIRISMEHLFSTYWIPGTMLTAGDSKIEDVFSAIEEL